MTRSLWWSCAAFVLIAWSASAAPRAKDPAEVFAAVSPAVLKIEVGTFSGASQGSAVVVATGRLVTNYHVVKGATGLLLLRQGKNSWRGEVVAVDPKNDLALVDVLLRPGERFDVAPVSFRSFASLKVGERAYAIGSPLGLEGALSDGLVSGLRTSESEQFVQTTAPISQGSSGGGLFDSEGKMIGVTTAYLRGGQNLNLAVVTDRVQNLLANTTNESISAARKTASSFGDAALPEGFVVPRAIKGVKALVVSPLVAGPLGSNSFTKDYLFRRVTKQLARNGVVGAAEVKDAARIGPYVFLLVIMKSYWSEQSRGYLWRLEFKVGSTATLSDGSTEVLSQWQSADFGMSSTAEVTDHVVQSIDRICDELAGLISS